MVEGEVPNLLDWLGEQLVFGSVRWVHAVKQYLGVRFGKRFYGLSGGSIFAVNGPMAKNNGKWVVGIILLAVAILAFISTRLKQDMMDRAPEPEAQASEAP